MAEMTLSRIVDGGLCSGCGACSYAVQDGSLTMRIDTAGYLRPHAARSLSADEEGRIRAVCPGIGLAHDAPGPDGVRYYPLWGPMARLAAGYADDAEVRIRGSSGGVLSALLIHLLDSKQVDFVVHTKSSAQDPLTNVTAFSRTREDILDGAGSRYAPAAPVAALHRALAEHGKFAFVGKPCDVAAVRKIIAIEPDLEARIPFLLSFMCAGTPSIHGTYEILKQFRMTGAELLSFRYRGDGWPGMTRAEAVDGRAATMDYNTAWGKILNRHLQPRCKKCADGTGEFADITAADAWYGRDGYPDFSEADGRSLLIARTAAGERLTAAAEAAGSVKLEEFDVQEIDRIQPYQRRRKGEMLGRSCAARILGKRWPRYRNLGLRGAATAVGIKATARAFIGTTIRLLTSRLQ